MNECKRKRKLDISYNDDSPDSEKNGKTGEEKSNPLNSVRKKVIENVPDQMTRDLQEKDLDELMTQLQAELQTSEEQLRKLKMAKMYREKNNLEELESLIEKWRSISQQAIQDLLELHPLPQPSLAELIMHLQIDHSLIHFNQEEGGFE